MSTTKGKVIHLYRRDPQEALERLNRITGLRFMRWPESLVPVPEESEKDEGTEPKPPEAGGCAAQVGGVFA
jgi:hypothetical protein